MIHRIILEDIEGYKKVIASQQYDEIYKWECLKTFKDNWNVEADDFAYMYDSSFKNKHSGNLWSGPHWFPKAAMLDFIKIDPERVRLMFRELFDEEKLVDKRIDRFVWHCDQFVEIVIQTNPSYRNHFHDGQRILTLYLSFMYPDKYAIYKFTEFRNFMQRVGANSIPGTGECERFFKVIRTIYGMLVKDQQLIDIHNSSLSSDSYKGNTLMLAQDFIFVTARRFMPKGY